MRVRAFAFAWVIAAWMVAPGAARAVEMGIKTGADFATFEGDFGRSLGGDRKWGFTGGGFMAFPASPRLAIQWEALYTAKGMKLTVPTGTDEAGTPTGPYDVFWSLHYIEVPVTLRIAAPQGWTWQPRAFFGPDLGITLSGNFRSKGGTAPPYSSAITHLKPVDVGFTAGAGVRRAMGHRALIGEARYTRGFDDIYDQGSSYKSINSVFSFLLGFEL